MGDRVLFQVVSADKKEFSPVIYGYWCGRHAKDIIKALRKRMVEGRPDDVSYAAARLVQEVLEYTKEGALSVGIWNIERILTEKDSHGDAGVFIINAKDFSYENLG
jgi:hypothetical protein